MDEENDETSSLSYPSHYYGWKKKKKIKICPSPSIWPSYSTPFGPLLKISIVAFISLLCSVGLTTAEKNKHYHVASLCKSHFLQQLYRKIDGAVLRSQNEPNLDCLITFQTETVLQRFMLRFDQLQLDCNDHLLVYDGAHATGNYKADLSCRHTRQSVGTIYTRTNFVTLKYITDGWGTDTNGFHLVITAFKDKTELICRDFRCAQKDFCISMDLLCDGVNHCGDNTDETTTSLCADQEQHFKILGLNLPVFGAVAGSLGVVLLCGITASLVVCCCRRKREPFPLQNANSGQSTATGNSSLLENNKLMHPSNNTSAAIGSQSIAAPATAKVLPTSGYMTLPLKSVLSGNRHPPAIGQGHFLQTVQRHLRHQLLSSVMIRSNLALYRGTTMKVLQCCLNNNFNWCLKK